MKLKLWSIIPFKTSTVPNSRRNLRQNSLAESTDMVSHSLSHMYFFESLQSQLYELQMYVILYSVVG